MLKRPEEGITRWFAFEWEGREAKKDISWKELRTITLMLATWARYFKGRRVRVQCDNEGVVKAARQKFCRDPDLMEEFRTIQVLAARNHFRVEIDWIAGKKNVVPDALSRLREKGMWRRACENASPPLASCADEMVMPPIHHYCG